MDKMKTHISIKHLKIVVIWLFILHNNNMETACRPLPISNYSNNIHPREVLELGEFDWGIDSEEFRKVEMCHKDEDLMELCQRCAKATKSKIVFPMCCSNEDSAKIWCHAYVHYGIE